MHWPLGGFAAAAFVVGAGALGVLWSRWSLAQERPRLAAALAWLVLPATVGLFAVSAREASPWEALSLTGLAAACAPLAAAASPGRGRARGSDFAVGMVISAPALWTLAALSRPASLWPVGMASLPFAFTLLGAVRGLVVANQRRADTLATLRARAVNLSHGHSGELLALDASEPGARALLDELHR